MQGYVIFLLGVSGSGKTTVLQQSGILDDPRYVLAKSYTTRPLRPGESDGIKYHHISEEQFTHLISEEAFLEYIHVHSMSRYGTSRSSLIEPIAQGRIALKEIDILGLMQIQKSSQSFTYHSVFLDIDEDVMRERIIKRGAMSEEEIAARLSSSAHERTLAREHCDCVIDASQSLENVITAFQSFLDRQH